MRAVPLRLTVERPEGRFAGRVIAGGGRGWFNRPMPVAVAMTLVGASRHRRLKRAARSASDAALDDRAVTAFTAGGTLLALATIALVLAQS